MKSATVILWICRLVAALIMVQSLFFKFSAAPESIYIFSKMGIEPWGRIGTGVLELIASILILIPRTSVYGALLSLGIISGAIFGHLFVIGIVVPNADGQGDGGQLFIYACLVFIASLIIIIIERKRLRFLR